MSVRVFFAGSCQKKILDIFGRQGDVTVRIQHSGPDTWKPSRIALHTRENYVNWFGNVLGELHNNEYTASATGFHGSAARDAVICN